MGHETKGRSEFENMINGFSKVRIGCCTARLYVLTTAAHVRVFLLDRQRYKCVVACCVQSWQTKKNESSVAVSAGDKAFLWCA